MDHSHTHSHHSHDHDHSSHPDDSESPSHDFVSANKEHHNETGHAHGHANSALNQWMAGKIADVLLKAYSFDEDTTSLLDFACGSGLISQQLAPHCKRIVGVDLAEQMVAVFNESVANQGINPSEMVAVQRDVLLDSDSELDGELFDVVLCAQAYHHIPDIDSTTLALSRRVKPGGVLFVVDLDSTSGFSELRKRTPKRMADKISKVVAHKAGFTEQELLDNFEKTDRFESVTVQVALSTMLSEMAAVKGKGNWAEGMVGGTERPDVEVRHLIAAGVRK